ncbi:MAG: hypothetical protein HOV94_15945 [Saccharothrix sp.]|nr:hypothetical protein [Saccharothrix sp.]
MLAAALVVATGVFTALYLGERADRDGVAATRQDRERSVAEVRDRQGPADRRLADDRDRASALTTENDLLTSCVDAARAYFDLPPGQTPESSRLFRVMYDVCPQI